MLELCRCPNIYGPDCIYADYLNNNKGYNFYIQFNPVKPDMK